MGNTTPQKPEMQDNEERASRNQDQPQLPKNVNVSGFLTGETQDLDPGLPDTGFLRGRFSEKCPPCPSGFQEHPQLVFTKPLITGSLSAFGAPPDEVYLCDSPAEPAPAVLGPPSQGDSHVSFPSWEDGTTLQPPPAKPLLLPHGPLRPGPRLTPVVGPVPHPMAEDLTTTYTQKAKQAKLQRAESLQERSVKEAKTKCGTIASLLSTAPNLHSKGVLMFKKRWQRDKKYPLVSFGAAAGTSAEEEDGLPPTSEPELDEEAFSYPAASPTSPTGTAPTWTRSYQAELRHSRGPGAGRAAE
ncbi:hypothetical protein JEQ12_006767 [Ovis aries]|uniref:Uncharacterized protein n=1 Tax=Ovis aries TaxID=9940 RepID=A0A835ZRJ3_SHEEP|nr:hypothetical protein JEQ12_006767 [Ovis aries]